MGISVGNTRGKQSHVRQHRKRDREGVKERESQFYCFYDCNKMQEIKKSNKLFKCYGDINTGRAYGADIRQGLRAHTAREREIERGRMRERHTFD